MSSTMISFAHRRIDLLRPDLSQIDIRTEIAETLAVIPRFGGHARSRGHDRRPYTVAQHCAVGAEALLDETGDADLALGFLLHDVHEAFMGDLTTPVADTLVGRMGKISGDAFRAALADLKRDLDVEIWRRAGIRPSPYDLRIIHVMDLRMLATEARQLLGVDPDREPHLWPAGAIGARPVKLRGALSPRPAKGAADDWMSLWDRLRRRPAPVEPPRRPTLPQTAAATAA